MLITTPVGTLKWHIHPDDLSLFAHLGEPDPDFRGKADVVPADRKYVALRTLTEYLTT